MSETRTKSAEVAFEITVRQLSAQKEDLRNIRNQASFGAALSGLIGTVFATLVDTANLRCDELSDCLLGMKVEFLLVLVLFSASIGFAIMVGVGFKNCVFDFRESWVLDQAAAEIDIAEIYRQLALDGEGYFASNEIVIEDATFYLWMSMVTGFSQIFAWVLII